MIWLLSLWVILSVPVCLVLGRLFRAASEQMDAAERLPDYPGLSRSLARSEKTRRATHLRRFVASAVR